jgi:hypothetical protein
MKPALCQFCGRDFDSSQGVRAHLRFCPDYKHMRGQLPRQDVPRHDTEPKAAGLGTGVPGNRSRGAPPARRAPRRTRQIEPEEARDDDELEVPHPGLVDEERERDRRAQQHAEAARHREQARETARLQAQQEAETRARQEAAERARKEARRRTIQRVKDWVIGGYWSGDYRIPPDAQAHALAEIEKELSKASLEDLPESELTTLTEGIRDRIYRPVIQAQDREREDEERKQKQDQRRTGLIVSGVAYARQELSREEDLDGGARWRIEQKAKEVLEQEITGTESETDLRPLVNEILDQELEEAEEKRREQARPTLIRHGAVYATRELARETGLEPRERWQIEAAVKEALEQELTGDESERDVENLVDAFLDEELGEPEEHDKDD